MEIKTISVGPLATNCYIAWGYERRALIIDPGDDSEMILNFLEQNQLDVAAYAVTHGHFDHISALADVSDAKPAPVGMHQKDACWAFSESARISPDFEIPRRPSEIERSFEDNQKWNDGGLNYLIIVTPGHSPGGICLYFPKERVLFSGDTLFRNSVGRTDLPGGNSSLLKKSLDKLSRLPRETAIYPGHGPATRLGNELNSNPFLYADTST